MKTTRTILPITITCLVALAMSCAEDESKMKTVTTEAKSERLNPTATATFGAGCFWCVEATFEALPGVATAVSGYMGGGTENPTYEQVCSGNTGHAEVVQVRYDPSVTTYQQLLDMFWKSHNPTTLDRQGADVGSQYRSVVFYHSDAQKKAAEDTKAKLQKEGTFKHPIVTQIAAAGTFYEAEDYHQDYFRRNASQPYCRINIAPKLKKLNLLK